MESKLTEATPRQGADLGLCLALLANIDLEVHRAVHAMQRWRSPRGNVIGLQDLVAARELVAAIAWPAALDPAARQLQREIDEFDRVLRNYDATTAHTAERRITESVRAFRQALLVWGLAESRLPEKPESDHAKI